MDQRSGQKRALDYLYPPVEPFDQRWMDMGDGHQIYVEQSGRPDGVPVFVFHGGPGGATSPLMRRFFDPHVYRIVMFDQRGCGRSTPHASVENNTTWHLISDTERIRQTLAIDSFYAFGGSWGATLALIYAISHPTRVRHLVLRGVFLMTQPELQWFYGGGAQAFFPDLWARFTAPFPETAPHDLIAAYHTALFSGERAKEIAHARLWAGWENALASIQNEGWYADCPSDYARAFARLENHYFYHAGFLPEEDWIIKNRGRIADIPCDIVQGRYDMVCPPISAHRLAKGWAGARLRMVPLAGHALSEPGIAETLVAITNGLRPR